MHWGSKVRLITVLAVLIGVNVLLLFLLFLPDRILIARSADQGQHENGWPTAPATMASTSASGDQTASASSEVPTDPNPSTHPVEPVPVERLLFAVSSKTAWRATLGDCNTPGEIERSTDGGASWKRIVHAGPAPIVGLGAEPSGELFAIGGTPDSCSVRYVAYANDGTVAASTNSAVKEWFPSPKDRDEINGPSRTKATPCDGHVIGFAPFDLTRALVICDNSNAMTTRDSGKSWRPVARLPNTLAVAAGSGRYWVAGVREGCDGVALQSLTEKSGSLTRGRTRCAAGLEVAAGQVAFDVTSEGTIWLWSGSRVVSTDDGQTWK
jgi:hypothetical protein